MFVRGNKNRSGSVSVQIIQKVGRRNKVIKNVGCATTKREEELLFMLAHSEIDRMRKMESLFIDHDDEVVENFVDSIGNDNLQIVGSQLILGHLYRSIGYPEEDQDHNFFKHLVLSRLVYPGSKLKTVEYFKRHLSIDVSVYSVYRYLDQLHSREKQAIEQITFEHTRKTLGGSVGVVFYDMTTLYFEASQEDDYKIIGYSKDGKPHKPQIIIGMLVGGNGYPIGYEVLKATQLRPKPLFRFLRAFRSVLIYTVPLW